MLQHLSFETSATPAKWHYTPKHGSWLDLAESELGILSSQCLDRRIPDKQTLIDDIARPQCQLHQFQVPRTNGLIPGRDVPVVILQTLAVGEKFAAIDALVAQRRGCAGQAR